MQYQNDKNRVRVSRGLVLRSFCKIGARTGLTLLEMILAMAMMAIIFAAIVPQLRPMLSSWDSKAGAGEAVQNGRVLIDHLKYNLSKAVKITDVSGSAVTEGYIEYEDNDGNTCRYDVASSYARFGVVGDLNDLAGPVSQLQFTCYDACDLDTPIPDVNDVNSIRFVKVQTTLTNADALGQDKTFIAQAYLRANASSGGGAASLGHYTALEYDIVKALQPALAQVDANHYLCVYSGELEDGYAVILTVDVNNTWGITAGTALEYDISSGQTPALAQIDSTHYLCAFDGHLGDGYAVVLTVDTGTWDINTAGTPLEYDTSDGHTPALAQIDSTHYLCAYTAKFSDGFALVLTVDVNGTWDVTAGTALEYDASNGETPALAQIDSTHYLCVYDGTGDDGYAVVLTVDVNGTWDITAGTAFAYDTTGLIPALAQLDSTHYLCAYTGTNNQGWAQVLTVDVNDTWDVNTAGTGLNFDSTGLTPALAQIDSTNYLCAYTGSVSVGYAVVLTVDTDTWTITEGTTHPEFDASNGETPALAEIINGTHYLCAYDGVQDDGWAVVLNYTAGGGGQLLP